ncbi:transporter substrate-binding domain-containing protein [Sinorhizobium sp. BG8]|uniref:transporter substrate-binding domain-containing protein n=1 Tax=Sinorhizobium sp. BG8 TaxID=2613773 RepID=UPI00193E95C2|nr:transporter substrate-binding domain-containing protein [Sinorhizobium sp. BG8]
MNRSRVPISILYSTTGSYAALGRDAVAGAMAAISEINVDGRYDFQFEPSFDDPGGDAERYAQMAEAAIRQKSCRHIVGTITSWSRKEVLPVIERHGALLWYAFPYEGYEASDRVVYLGACPNQHLLPLFDYAMPEYGKRPYFVGSNYIWGWEIGRIAREITEAAGGEVVGERFMPLGCVDAEHIIADIRQKKPDFVFSCLVGASSTAFIKAYAELRERDPEFDASRRPLVACNLSESDLEELSPFARTGHITTAMYFDQLPSEGNLAFKARLAANNRAGRHVPESFALAYMAVSILAQAITDAGTDDPDVIRKIVTQRNFDTPLGPLAVDPRTHHADLRPYIGRSNGDGEFEIFYSAEAPIAADPYLVRSVRSVHGSGKALTPDLKVVR